MLCEFMNNDDDEQLGAHIVQCFDDDIRPVVVAAAAVASRCTVPQRLHGSVQGFFSQVVPTYSPEADTFKSHFRMTRNAFELGGLGENCEAAPVGSGAPAANAFLWH